MSADGLDAQAEALVTLGRALREQGYTFTTPTPETHRRVNARVEGTERAWASTLRDVFGWSRPFRADTLDSALLGLLEAANALERDGERLRSKVRYATLRDLLLVHSAYPTRAADSVFFGPDTYRFCDLLERWAPRARRVIDIGCGSGAGGLSLHTRADELVLCDINTRALTYARVNARLLGRSIHTVESDVLRGVKDPFDLVIANPPYMRDAGSRLYRDGGGSHGEALSVRIVRESLERLSPGGKLILYTGAAIVAGRDTFYDAVSPVLHSLGVNFVYQELDPDVFGEELSEPGYEDVERIAAVGLKVVR